MVEIRSNNTIAEKHKTQLESKAIAIGGTTISCGIVHNNLPHAPTSAQKAAVNSNSLCANYSTVLKRDAEQIVALANRRAEEDMRGARSFNQQHR